MLHYTFDILVISVADSGSAGDEGGAMQQLAAADQSVLQVRLAPELFQLSIHVNVDRPTGSACWTRSRYVASV